MKVFLVSFSLCHSRRLEERTLDAEASEASLKLYGPKLKRSLDVTPESDVGAHPPLFSSNQMYICMDIDYQHILKACSPETGQTELNVGLLCFLY